jgi:ABC-type transport system involved in cytochrome c biogenesis permease subunit
MVSWHLLTHPSYPRWLAFAIIQPFNFVAEGFVLLAGVAVGLQIAGGKSRAGRLFRRAGTLLVMNYGLVLFIVLLAMAERRLGVQMPADLPDSVAEVVTC